MNSNNWMKTKVNKFEIWLADLNPQRGTEPGKTRPVLVVQTNLLNEFHPSTVVLPITTNVILQSEILRVHLTKGTANVKEDCDIMMDQIRAIDNNKLIKKIGTLPNELTQKVAENLAIILDL